MADSTNVSESYRLSAILSLSGGLQDAYTYNVRGQVFANAQTGNVILMSQHMMQGQWGMGLRYLIPLLAFAFGILVAEYIGRRFKNSTRLHWRQIVLLVEMVLLAAVGFIPLEYNMVANAIVSFTCAMQVQTFRKVLGYGYASTMCIGNLRSATESLSIYMHEKDKEALKKALAYYGIVLIFAIGAGIGGILSLRLGPGTIWICDALLLIDLLMMNKEPKRL